MCHPMSLASDSQSPSNGAELTAPASYKHVAGRAHVVTMGGFAAVLESWCCAAALHLHGKSSILAPKSQALERQSHGCSLRLSLVCGDAVGAEC